MSSVSSNSSSGSGSSSSTPTVVNTAQSDYLLQLAQEADQLAQAQYQWGKDQFAKDSTLTDQVVNNFLTGASAAFQQGTTDLSDYNNLFRPENAQLVADANDYASTARIQKNMGSAEAGVQQGMESGRQNAEKDLQAFGIDPSSGRYKALDDAERVQAGAAAAGAGNQSEAQTEATGRSLRSQAIQVGETIPGQAMNEFNVSNAGNAAAQNAKLANTTVGANILGTPQNYMGTAMGLKLPPVGQNSTSQNSQQSSGGSRSQQDPQKQSNPNNGTRPGSGNGGGNGAGGGFNGANGGGGANPASITFPGQFDAGSPFDVGNANDYLGGSNFDDPTSNNYGADQGVGGYDPGGSSQSGFSPSSGSGGGGSSFEGGQSTGGGGQSSGYYSGGQSTGGSGGGGSSYAQGGPVRPQQPQRGGIPMTTGGGVPLNASPSGGKQTDDVNARLNAGEFVIPKDVATWRGHGSYQKDIDKARQEMQGGTAKPQMKQAIPGPATFASHVMNRNQGMPTNGRR